MNCSRPRPDIGRGRCVYNDVEANRRAAGYHQHHRSSTVSPGGERSEASECARLAPLASRRNERVMRSPSMPLRKRLLALSVALLAAAVAATPAQEKTQPKPGAKAKAAPKLPEGTQAFKDVAYVPGGTERQTLDLFVPKADAPLPLVVWIHGGGWQQGSKDGGNPALPLLAKGFAVAS